MDKTGVECFANHVHITDYVKGDSFRQLQQGTVFVRSLAKKKLRQSYPRTSFRLILSHSQDSVSVRCHKLRVGEEWVSNDLEEYKDESIYVLMVCANRSKYSA
jgi:hypothetical protein